MPPETDNLQLEELFQEDQKDREKVYDTPEDVEKLKERDRSRRKRVHMMMELGEVKTKRDLYHAAVIFQHGDKAEEFLISHRLSTMAALLGHRTARWLLAASFDRYLMAIGQPQIEYNPNERVYQLKLPIQETVMLSYDKELFGVPAVGERLKQLNSQIKK
jgi:hypothetical protein